MKNIHLVPSPNPSRLFIDEDDTKLRLYKEPMVSVYATNQNIYITNDEEIKDGTWVIHKRTGKVMFLAFTRSESYNKNKDLNEEFSKIILTTDPDLIKDGVQAIDDDFLEWFIRNSSCEEVVIEKYCRNGFCDGSGMCRYLCECIGKRITIPREELVVVETTLEDFRVKPKEEPKQDFYKTGDFHKNCDDSCKYHCTKGNTQLAECLKEPKLEVEWVSNNPQCKQTESCYNSLSKKCICPKEEPKQDKITERFIANAKQQETLEDKLKLLVEEWRKRQLHYEEVAEDDITSEHNNRKFTYKAMATRDCWKELLKLIENGK